MKKISQALLRVRFSADLFLATLAAFRNEVQRSTLFGDHKKFVLERIDRAKENYEEGFLIWAREPIEELTSGYFDTDESQVGRLYQLFRKVLQILNNDAVLIKKHRNLHPGVPLLKAWLDSHPPGIGHYQWEEMMGEARIFFDYIDRPPIVGRVDLSQHHPGIPWNLSFLWKEDKNMEWFHKLHAVEGKKIDVPQEWLKAKAKLDRAKQPLIWGVIL